MRRCPAEKHNTYQIFNHTEDELIKMDNPFALVIIASQQEAVYNKKEQSGLYHTRMKIVRALKASEKFNYKKIKDFLYFMDQLIPLTDRELKIIFDKEIINLFGGKITMGIMEAVREQLLDEGREQGREEGKEQWIEQGRYEKALKIAHELKVEGSTTEFIAKTTKLSVKEIEALV